MKSSKTRLALGVWEGPFASASAFWIFLSVFRKIYPKSPYPSLRTSGNPINKGFLVFNPSLNLSRHPSLIPPINSFRQPNEGEVIKTMNCDQIISIMQKDVAYYEVVPLKAA